MYHSSNCVSETWFSCHDTVTLWRDSNPLSFSKVMVVARMQWLVYSVDSSAVREILFMNPAKVLAPMGSFLYQALSDSTKQSLGCTKRRSIPLCLLERYFSNDEAGHIAFPGVSYILPSVPSMSLITLFPWWFLSSSDVILKLPFRFVYFSWVMTENNY